MSGRKLSGCAPKFTASAAKFVSCKGRGSPQLRQKRSWGECSTRLMSFVPNATSSRKVSLGQRQSPRGTSVVTEFKWYHHTADKPGGAAEMPAIFGAGAALSFEGK